MDGTPPRGRSEPSWPAQCKTDPVRTILNLIWLVLSGLWLALAYAFAGAWIAIAHVLPGLILCLTIVGIPLGLGNFKLAAVAIAPLGKEIVSTSDPRAALGAISF